MMYIATFIAHALERIANYQAELLGAQLLPRGA